MAKKETGKASTSTGTSDASQAQKYDPDTEPREKNKGKLTSLKSHLSALLPWQPTKSSWVSERRQAQRESNHVNSPAQQCYLFTLLEDILWDILLWTRPDDQDQTIWLWLCRVGATCKVFRRLVRVEKKGAPLLPTVFKLENTYFWEEDRCLNFPLSRYPVYPRVKLMDTIRKSGWMGSNIRSICALKESAVMDDRYHLSKALIVAFKKLFIAPCFPNLLDVTIYISFWPKFSLVSKRFLRELAQVHPGLRSLYLMNLGHSPVRRKTNPDPFATLAASMRCLQEAGIGQGLGSPRQLSDEHFAAFIANLNPRLASLVLDFKFHVEPGDEGFSNLYVSQNRITGYHDTTTRRDNSIQKKTCFYCPDALRPRRE